MADTKTYLKVPYNGQTLRALPLNSNHITGLVLVQQMQDVGRQAKAITRVLARVLDETAYDLITDEFIDGNIDIHGLVKVLEDVAKATEAYHRAKRENSVPEHATAPEPDAGTGGE